jgi:hypothetical protein
MTIAKLIGHLLQIQDKYGNIEVQMCIEVKKGPKKGQVQQIVSDLTVATERNPVQTTEGVVMDESKMVVLLPEGF